MKKNLSNIASTLGKKGGKETLKRKGKKHFSEIGKKGALSRWNKKV